MLLAAWNLVAFATTTINHQFTPATINPGDTPKYRITLTNDDTGSSLSSMKVTVVLQPQITVASPANITNTCGFTVNQPVSPGTSTIELVGGTLAAGTAGVPSQCYFEIDVTATSPGNWINTIPANPITGPPPGTPTIIPDATTTGYLATTTTSGVLVANTTPATATLSVNTLTAPGGAKAFSPGSGIAGDPVTLTITLSNPNAAATMPLTTFTDALPDDGAGHAMLVNGAPTSVCTGAGSANGSITAASDNKSVTLTGGTIGSSGACTLTVPVVVSGIVGTQQTFSNSVAAGAIGNVRGLTSAAFNRSITVFTPIAVGKTFSVSPIPAGQPSLMTLTVRNNSSVRSLDVNAFSDNLTGTTLQVLNTASSPVAALADPAISCTGSGAANGTLSYAPDALDTTIAVAGAVAGPGGVCTITAYVTSYVDGAHLNTTSKVTNPAHNYDSTPASASVTSIAQLQVTKSVSVNSIAPGQWTEFTITIRNYSGGLVNNVFFRDLLPTNGSNQLVVYDPAATTSGIYVASAGCIGGTYSGLDASGVSTGSAPVSGVDAGLQWSGGSIVGGVGASPGICTLKIRVRLPLTATAGMSFTNTIPQSSITGGLPGGGTITNPDTTGSAGVVTVASVAVNKSFAPGTIAQGGTSTLSISVSNRVVTALTAINLTDNLPAGVVLAANPAPSNTCGGTLQAFPGDSQVVLSGGTLAARPDTGLQATCTISVRVTASAVGTYTNIIAPADFSTSVGTIPASVAANLNVSAGITGSKSFLPAAVTPGGTARVSIAISNSSSAQLTNVSINDNTFSAGLSVANPANAATSCAGTPTLVVNPGATRAQMLGATLNAGASCTFSFDVATSGGGPWSDTIPVGNVSSAQGPFNTAAIAASLGVNTANIGINKSFLTPVVTGGVPSVLQIDVINNSSITVHNAAFTDTFPLGIQVYSVPSASTTCAGGTVAAVPGDGKVVLTGATLAPNANCKVLVTTTSVKFLNLTNTIPAFSVSSAEGYSNPLATSASLSTLQGLGVMKGFAPAFIASGQTSRLRVTLVSTFDPNAVAPVTLTGVSFTDTLPSGVTVATPASAATTCSNGSGGFATVTPAVDNLSVTLSGATMPPGTSCVIEVDVTASAIGAYDNTIAQSGVTSTQGIGNQTAATARLNVVTQPTVAKAFSVSPVQIGQVSRLTVTISNGSGVALSGISLADTLPAGLAIAGTPNAATTCSNGVVAADAGDNVVSVAGATLASSAACTFRADVVANAAGSYANNIAAATLIDDQGLVNPGPATATLVVLPPAAVTKQFNPVSITSNAISTLTLTLANSSAGPITLIADLVDALPGNVLVAPTPNVGGTCVGTKSAAPGGTSLTLASGASIPAASSCTVTVDVTSSMSGSYVNVIAAGQLQTSAGNNQNTAVATLGVDQAAPPTIDKAFSPTSMFAGGTSTLTITLGNGNATALTLSAPFTDTLPSNVTIQGTPTTSCAGTLSGSASAVTLDTGASIPAVTGCTITLTVTSAVAGSYTNTIPALNLVTDGGSPPLPASASLVVTVLVPPGVLKSFSPGTINPGGVSTLTITLANDNASAAVLTSTLTDTLPTNVLVANPPAIGGTCTTPSVAATAGTSVITYASGAPIPAGGCTITVAVTSAAPGGPYTNTIGAGALVTTAGSNGAGAVANLFVNPFQPPSVNKSFSNALLPRNGTSTLTISLGNGNAAPITLSSDFVDTLPGSVVVATPSGLVTSTGCDAAKVLAPAGGATVTYQSGATLAGGGGCTIQVNVTSATAGSFTNSIGSGSLQTSAGTNAVGATAPVQFVDLPTNVDLALSKTMTPGSGVAGSAQTLTLAWRNTNAASPVMNLYQCVVSDPLPTAAFDLATDTPVVVSTPAGYTFAVSGNTITYTRINTATPCETTLQTATVTVKLKAGVVTGSTYTNTATFTAKTLPSNDPNAGAAATLSKTASASVAVTAASTSSKTVVSTSQGFTDPSDTNVNANPVVAIGETVTYSIPFTLPPGVTSAVTLADEIITGVGDVVLVSASLARSSINLSAAGNPASINAAGASTPVDVTSLATTTGNELRFALGDVTNADVSNQTYTLVVTARVANVAGNTLSHVISDRGRLRYQDASATAMSVVTAIKSVHVGLPGMTVTKSVAPAAPSAGGTVTYTLTLSNPAGTNAVAGFDVTFGDTLPADLQSPSAPSFNVGSTGAAASGSFTGNVLSGTIDRLDPGESVVVTYTAQVNASTPFGKAILNSASAQTTTLPGADANERSIASSAVSATLTTATPSIAKIVVAPKSRYAIGDVVAYRVTVSVPVGTTTNFTVADTLPAGLAYVSGSATLTLSSGVSGPAPGAFVPTLTAPLTFPLGSITATSAGTLTLDYQAQVRNIGSNQNGSALVNSVQATYDRPGGGTNTLTVASPPSITVGEPNFTMAKTIVSGSVGAQAGSVVRWRYTLLNGGTTTAYQASIVDTLPSGLFNIGNISVTPSGGNIQQNNAGCTSGSAIGVGDASVSTTVNAADTLALAGMCIVSGATLTVDFDSVVMNSVTPSQVLNNVVRASYASQPTGASGSAVVRDGADAGTDDDVDPIGTCNGSTVKCNNYNESASNTLTIAAPIAIDKQASATTATIGQTLTYSLKVSLLQGNTPAVVVQDVLPAGLTYVSSSVNFGHIGIAPSNAGYATRLGSGQTVQFNFGNVQNDADGNSADDWLNIDIVVRVDNVIGNQSGVVLSNGAGGSVSVQYGAGPTTLVYDFDAGTPGIQGRPLTLTEPVVTATKAVVPTSQALGDIVTYSVTLAHTGASTADALDVQLTDTLAPGLVFVPGSVTPANDFVGIAGQVLSLQVDPLDPLTLAKHDTTITYRARIATSAVVGAPLANTIAGTYASLTGATGAATSGRNGSGGINDYTLASAAAVTPNQSSAIYPTKTVVQITDNGNGVLEPGEQVEYTVVLTNTTANALTNVAFTDVVPAQLTYLAGTLNTSLGTVVDSGAPSLVVNIGLLGANAIATVRLRAQVNAGVPTGTVISNQGRVDSDQTVTTPTDGDGVPGNGAQPTTITVGGTSTPSAALYAQKLVALQADNDASGTITQGDRMRYTIVLSNTGGSALSNVSFGDVIPSGLAYATGSATASVGTLGVVGSAVAWTGIGSLAPGAVVSATFDVIIASVTAPSQTFVNQGTAVSTQTGNVRTDSDGDASDGNQPTQFVAVSGGVAQPILDVQKRWSVAIDTAPAGVPSPGDTLQYTITVANNGSAAAGNVRLTDAVPTCTGVLNPCTAYVAGSLTTSLGAIVTESPIAVNLGTLPIGGFATVTFRVLVNLGTADGVVVANQASVTRTGSATPVLSDDNGNPGDGINPTLTPIATSAGGNAYPAGLTKQLVGSSETASVGTNVLVGEVLRYRVSVTMPKGTTRQVALSDVLPAGLTYLPGSARLARVFDTALVASSNPGGVNSAASGVFVSLVDGSGIAVGSGAGSTTTLDVALGDVIDSDADTTTPETYTLEYRAVVGNTAGNQSATTLANAATVRFWNTLGQSQSLTPVAVTVVVSEPVITLTKAATPGSLLTTGGSTQFTLTIANAAGANVAPAFDVALSDAIPAIYASVGARAITSTGATGIADTTSGTVVGATIGRLDPGGSVTIVFSATAPGPLPAGAYVNNANATWTSLPGSNGSAADGTATPGAPGTATGERIGSGGVNDYATTASATVIVGGVAISKSLVSPQARYAIGDVVRYRVDIAVPGSAFGAVPAAVLTDILAPGLTYETGSLAVAYNGVVAGVSPSDFVRTDNAPSAGQETLTASFGTLSNGNVANATVMLTYSARVDDLLSNQANTILGNQASLTFTDTASGGATATRGPVGTSVTVGEPFLALSKALTSPAAGLVAGSTASFIVNVSNTGTTTAFETVLTDALPAGLFFPAGSTVSVTPTNASGNLQVPTVSGTAAGWQTSAFDLPVGDSVSLAFTATLAGTVQPGQTLQNTVAATYTSRDGADTGERSGASPASSQTDDTQLDNYNVNASAASLTVADPIAIAKAFQPNAAQSRYAIGQLVTYRLTLSVLEGTTRSVRVADTLPAGLTFVSSGDPGAPSGAPITFTYAGAPTVAGQAVTFDLGDVIDQPNGNASDDFISIDVTARVDNVVANQDATNLGNNVRVTFVDAGSVTRTRDFDADAGTIGVQPLVLTVVEPALALTKTANVSSQSLGDLVTFTLTAAHTAASHANAYDVVLVDTLPSGMVYEPGSVNPPGAFGSITGPVLTLNVGALTLSGASRTITYQARVLSTATPGDAQTNTVQATWSSIPGGTGAPTSGRTGSGGVNDYVTSAQATIIPNANAQITAAKSVAMVIDADGSGNLTGGDTLEWTIVLTNTGGPVTGVVFSDGIPANTSFVTGSLTTSKGSAVESPLPLTVNVGPMAAAEVVTIRLRTTVNVGLPSGTLLSNQGSVDSDQTVPSATDSSAASGNQPTTITVQGSPDLVIAKSHLGNFIQGQVGATWTIVVTNAGTAPTIAAVNVVDTLPSGTTATAIGGSGWSCTLSPLACARSDALQAGASWPAISVVVTLDPLIATGTISNSAHVAGGGESVITNNDATDTASVTTRTLFAPSLTKTATDIAPNLVEWRLVVINAANTLPLTVRLSDPVPFGLAYTAGSLSCHPAGSTVTTRCAFDAASSSVIVDARLGPDAGHFDETAASNALVVVFRTNVGVLHGGITNVATVVWDANSTGSVDDDSGLITATASVGRDVAIPVNEAWMLVLMALLVGGVGLAAMTRRK